MCGPTDPRITYVNTTRFALDTIGLRHAESLPVPIRTIITSLGEPVECYVHTLRDSDIRPNPSSGKLVVKNILDTLEDGTEFSVEEKITRVELFSGGRTRFAGGYAGGKLLDMLVRSCKKPIPDEDLSRLTQAILVYDMHKIELWENYTARLPSAKIDRSRAILHAYVIET